MINIWTEGTGSVGLILNLVCFSISAFLLVSPWVSEPEPEPNPDPGML